MSYHIQKFINRQRFVWVFVRDIMFVMLLLFFLSEHGQTLPKLVINIMFIFPLIFFIYDYYNQIIEPLIDLWKNRKL